MAMTFKTNLVPDLNLVRELGSSTAKWKINGVEPLLTDTATAKDDILDGSNLGTQITYAPYTSKQSGLKFYTGTTNPDETTRLNLNGYLYATKLYSGGSEVITKSVLSGAYDILYSSAANTPTRLAANTTTTRKFLRMTGTGSAGAAPTWDTVTKTDVGLSNVENTALSTWAGSSNITTIGTLSSGTVPWARLSNIPTASTSTAGIILITSTNTNAFINALSTGDSIPVDNDYFISLYVGGGTSTTTYYRRPMTTLASYILGKLNTAYVLKAGDTMTGLLTTEGYGINIKSNSLSNATNPSEATNGPMLSFIGTDNPLVRFGYLAAYKYSSGTLGLLIAGRKNINGTDYSNRLRLLIDNSGNYKVEVSSPAAWRDELNVVNKSGDTMNGNLIISHATDPCFHIKHPNMNVAASLTSSGNSEYSTIRFRDQNEVNAGYIQCSLNGTNGRTGLAIYANRRNGSSTTNVANGITFYVSADGTRSMSVSDTALWRSTLELNSYYVQKVGDTMTGSLSISNNDNPNLKLINPHMNITANSLSTDEYNSIYFRDNNSNNLAYILQSLAASDGHTHLTFGTRALDSSSNVIGNYFTLYSYKNGTRSVYISHPSAWRDGLNVVNRSGDTMTGSLYIRHVNTKGTAPSESVSRGIIFVEAGTGTAAANRTGLLFNTVNASETVSTYIYAYKSEAGSTANSYFGPAYLKDGTLRTYTNCKVYGAVWNDYAEYRLSKEEIKPGYVIKENGDDTVSLATERLMRGCKIVSDTFGFAIGETDECKTPIAVSGRVLVYTYEDRELYRNYIGWPVCSGPHGKITLMSEEEEEKYPSRILGTVSSVPDYEEWGELAVKVDGRIWIYVK